MINNPTAGIFGFLTGISGKLSLNFKGVLQKVTEKAKEIDRQTQIKVGVPIDCELLSQGRFASV